ncbi:DHHC zinc finger domain containing protein [Histomonas meleagridis]|uniref:DHHC zinc finger domain containing protein n=1 Tax=Histomonas meleagridis TaxID=135588 RepID=UPI00355ABB9B|nr:DHHC zinc finger domain containing protein [Histomonas meleagridis]KAH0799387.1 DHHC zinc finger domain containing protein [Histomonas meleagridis]
MAWRIDKLSPRIRWDPDLKMRNFFICVAVIMRTDLFTAANFVILSVIVVVLTFFVGQVCYFISINVTQIEIDKYEAVKEYRAKIGNKEPVRNFYSKGFIGNWKSFWFPPKIVKHQPMEYSIEGDNIVGKPMKTADENRKSLPRNKRSKK